MQAMSETAMASPADECDALQGNGKISFAGVTFDGLDVEALVTALMARAPEARFAFVVTPNVDHLVQLDRNPSFAAAYDKAQWRVNDSRVLRRLARFCGKSLPLACGSDLTALLVKERLPRTTPVTIIGGGDGLAEALNRQFGLTNIHHYEPPMGFMMDRVEVEKCLAFCRNHRAHFYFFAVGAPRQELLAAELVDDPHLRGIGLCIGASFDFLTGKQERAPQLWQNLGMEWLYRLINEPKRLAKRYLVDGPAVVLRIWRFERG
jgi:N-acetylglucosaminyldiphosphoundecaprenol N-acetyl-beta-D-mannosaminyltransferase